MRNVRFVCLIAVLPRIQFFLDVMLCYWVMLQWSSAFVLQNQGVHEDCLTLKEKAPPPSFQRPGTNHPTMQYYIPEDLNPLLLAHIQYLTLVCTSGVPRGGFGVFKPPPVIPKISVESSIAQARRTSVSISFYSSLCSYTVVIY